MIRRGEVEIHDSLEPLLDDVSKLRSYERNPRKGDVDLIVESMRTNGMYRPVYARRETGEVLAGNHTLAAAKQLGAKEVPVVWLDVDDDTAKKVVLVDNRAADAGTYDNSELIHLLTSLAESNDIVGTGYDAEALAQLEAIADTPPPEPGDFGIWPTLSFQVHPNVRRAFLDATTEASSDDERFTMLMTMAGIW